MQTAPLFSLDDVGKRFGHRYVLRGISLEIPAGGFLLLLGGNGAGKSTLLKIMSSLMRPSNGRILFRGRPYVESGRELRGAIGVLSHESQFYGDLTARENLRVFGTLYGVGDLKSKIGAVLEQVKLADFPEVPVRAFSSGMVKRLALGRLTLTRPRVLLLDEPYAGLDLDSVKLLDGFLRSFKSEGGTTVMVTHQFTEGVGFCDRLLILHQGALVYNRPAENLSGQQCALLLDHHSRAQSGPPLGTTPATDGERES